jgi:hypothetical protein
MPVRHVDSQHALYILTELAVGLMDLLLSFNEPQDCLPASDEILTGFSLELKAKPVLPVRAHGPSFLLRT